MDNNVIKNLFEENIPISEALEEINIPSKEEVIFIDGEDVPRRTYNACIKHYLKQQYGD